MYREICQRITNDFGVKLSYIIDDPTYYKSNPHLCDLSIQEFIPGCFVVCKPVWEIFVGIFIESEEQQLASVLHEFGHIAVEYKKYCNNFIGLAPPPLKESVLRGEFGINIRGNLELYEAESMAWEWAHKIAAHYSINWTEIMSKREQTSLQKYRAVLFRRSL
jgi:hypothetical protein